MANRNIIANLTYRTLVKGMQNGSVLDINSVANLYCVNISAEDSAVPDAAVVANGNIANYNTIFC